MHLKPRHKRRIYWSVLWIIGILAMLVVLIPSFINLNNLKPKIENAVFNQTGIKIQIGGNVNFSLMGPTIVAHKITLPNGHIEYIGFKIRLINLFNTDYVNIDDNITVHGADIDTVKLTPPKFGGQIEINDSKIHFMGKDYKISYAKLKDGLLNGTVRTSQHKYEFSSDGDKFNIKNNEEDLNISGTIYSDGTAHGTLAINTLNVNKFFEFDNPKITNYVKFTTDFDWDGGYGFKFKNINGGNFSGEIELEKNGHRKINMIAKNTDIDISFILFNTDLIYDADLNLNLTGNLKFGNKIFNKLIIESISDKTYVKIKNIVADNIKIIGGKITENGAADMPIYGVLDDKEIYCLFSGNPINWACSEFEYGNISGNLNVDSNRFRVFIKSENNIPENYNDFTNKFGILGDTGTIDFIFLNATGNMEIKNNSIKIYFDKINNKSLSELGVIAPFLPKYALNEIGTFSGKPDENKFSFIPNSKDWNLYINGDEFILNGSDIKNFISDNELPFIKDNMAFEISGKFKNDIIAELEIRVADQIIFGTINGDNLNLKTDILNIDSLINQRFIDNYQEEQFLTASPITVPFEINKNISLTADSIIYNGNEFANFVYSLKSGAHQIFSITDNLAGNLLATISKNKNIYDIELQLNKFDIPSSLLIKNLPINIIDTTLTAQINLQTNGKIAYDITNNLSGDIDMSFDGGTLIGIGTDGFYSNAKNITTLNAEDLLSMGLDGGRSQIKKLRITGNYEMGRFKTTRPFILNMRHIDTSGHLQTGGGTLAAQMVLSMRGTSPEPVNIDLNILPNGVRKYSLSEIMRTFDPDFLRTFTETHDKF